MTNATPTVQRGEMKAISFFVPGEPKAQPRARSFVIRGPGGKPIMKNGQPIIRVHEAGTAENWKSAIAQAAKAFVPMPPLQGPLKLDIDFQFPRPKDHYKSQSAASRMANAPRLLKPGAPNWHTKKPDRDNLEKAVTDALKVIGMFSDDCQICAGEVLKQYSPKIINRTDELRRPNGYIQINSEVGAFITIIPLEQPASALKRDERQPELVMNIPRDPIFPHTPDPDEQRDVEVADKVMESEVKCACVHHDPYECARLRDRRVRDAGDVDECMDPERRGCECACHDNYNYDYDDDYCT